MGAVIIDEHGRLLMVRRAGGVLTGLWSVPGGRVEPGETLREAVIREVREETALEVEVQEVVWVGQSIGPGDPPEWHYVLIDFLARVMGGRAVAGGDADRVAWVPLEEVRERPVTPTLLELLEELAGG